MIKKILTGVLFLLIAFFVAFFATSLPDASAGPLLSGPTPTSSWHVVDHGDSTATHDGDSGITLGNSLGVSADDFAEAVVIRGEKICPGGANAHWAKARWFIDPTWSTFFNIQTCGEVQWKWFYSNNNYPSVDVDDQVWAEFPALDGDPSSGTWGLHLQESYYQAFTEAGTGGDAGYQSYLQVYYLRYGVDGCITVDPDEREFISSGLLFGIDEIGETFPLISGQEYLLMTNAGPWNDGIDDNYDIAVRFKTPHTTDPPAGIWGAWTALADVSGESLCSTAFLDANGSVLVFTAEDEQAQIQFRVNDIEDEFDDNSGDLEYFWLGEEGSSQGCEDTWTVGAKVAGRTIPADQDYIYNLTTDYSGGNYDGRIAPGQSYVYQLTGSYLDNGVESTDSIVLAGASGTPWTDPNDAFTSDTEQCEDDNVNGIAYYGTTVSAWDFPTFNIPGSEPYFEINDDTGDKSNNTGSIIAEWYEGSWTPPPTTCATKYSIGTFIESPIFFANNSDGQEYPQHTNGLIDGQVYYLESQGTPYSLNGELSYDFEIGTELDVVNAVIWQSPEIFVDCINPVDTDRNGYYFTANSESFWLRAETLGLLGTHADNTGTLKFNLYGAVPNEVPAEDSCSDYYDLNSLVWRGSFDADDSTGYAIDHSVFTPGDRYALKITGAFTEPDGDGKTGQVRRAYPTQGSVDWEDMSDWTGAICAELDQDDFDTVYFEASALSDYEIRAHTPTGNTGTLEFEVWSLDQTALTAIGCEYNYADIEGWYLVADKDKVIANNEGVEYDENDDISAVTGYVMARSFAEDVHTYKFETDYLDGDINLFKWNLQISEDGGATWIFLADWADCYIDLISATSPVKRGYFTSPVEGGPFILRVYDVGGIYWNNVGGVDFSMWIDEITADPGDVWQGDWYDPNKWGAGCNTVCPSPGWLQVGEWVEFARCRFTSWLSWCPTHAEQINEIEEIFTDVEPFKTIFELMGLGRLIRDELDLYSWNNDGGGSGDGVAQLTTPPNFIFMQGDSGGAGVDAGYLTGPDSIWGSGEIDLTPDNSIAYKTTCDMELANSLGSRLAGPMCFGFNVLDQLGMRLWFQLIWDFFMLFMLGMYIKKSWVDKLQ